MASQASIQQVKEIYLAYYGRPADPGGLEFWANRLDAANGDLSGIIDAFASSAEAQARFGGLSATETINVLYNQLLGRNPDPVGLEFWTERLNSGETTAQNIALQLLDGAQNQDVLTIQNKLAVADNFIASLSTPARAGAYAGEKAVSEGTALLAGVSATTDPATVSVEGVVTYLINDGTFTLIDEPTPVAVIDPPEQRLMWGYTPTNGGIPASDLVEFLTSITGVDFVELGLIDDDGVDPESAASDITEIVLGDIDSGGGDITITTADGRVISTEADLGENYLDFLSDLLFDENGDSRLYLEDVPTSSSSGSSGPDPVVLTTNDNNGRTVETGTLSAVSGDQIIAGRTELLHGAIIDAGGGSDTVEVDMKGVFAQPLRMTSVETVIVNNLPNFYTNADGSSSYPALSTDAAGSVVTDSMLDLSRAMDIEKLVITQGFGEHDRIGDLTVFGVRNGATLRLEGGFTEDVNVHYGEGLEGPLTVELALGDTDGGFDLNVAHNTNEMNLVSIGAENWLEDGFFGGTLRTLNISGDAALHIEGDLDSTFLDSRPATIDASENMGGVELTLSHEDALTFIGTDADDDFTVNTDGQDETITIANGEGDDQITVNGDFGGEDIEIVGGSGDGEYTVEGADNVDIVTGTGDDDVLVTGSDDVTVASAGGDNTIEIASDSSGTAITGAGDDSIEIDSFVATAIAGDGDNSIILRGNALTAQSGEGDDTVWLEGQGDPLFFDGGGATGAFVDINTGAGSDTVYLGFDPLALSGVTAIDGSSISGENVTLFVDADSDLSRASLSGITRVILEDDLVITADQFSAIGAAAFETHRSSFGRTSELYVVITEDTTLSDLVDLSALDSSVKLHLVMTSDVTLTLSAEELHTYVAENGIDVDDDGILNGNVVITDAGLRFDPFAAGVGSLSDSFLGSEDVEIQVEVDGFNRPNPDPSESTLTIDGDETPIVGDPISTSLVSDLVITGSAGIEFMSSVDLGGDFTIDFSALAGELVGLTIADFDEVEEIIGNGVAGTRIDVEIDDDVGAPGIDNGLASSGVSTYVVTDLDGGDYDFYVCDLTQGLTTLGLQGNISGSITFWQVQWGVSFLLEGDGNETFSLKSLGNPAYSNIGEFEANFEYSGASAVVEVNNQGVATERPLWSEGITVNGADDVTINVSDSSAILSSVSGSGLESLILTGESSVTILAALADGVESVDVSGVVGGASVSSALTGADEDFSFVGGDAVDSLTMTMNVTLSSDASIDGGAGGVVVSVDGGDVDFSAASMANVSGLFIGSGDTAALTIDQVTEIGAANIEGEDATSSLTLTGLSDQPFSAADFEVDVDIDTVEVAAEAVVTLHPDTDLTGITTLQVNAGTVLNLTAAQFQQMLTYDGAGNVIAPTIEGVGGTTAFAVNITDVTQADVDAGLDLSGITAASVSFTLAESVTMPEDAAATPTTAEISTDLDVGGLLTINIGDDMTLSLPEIADVDANTVVNGGTNSVLQFSDSGYGGSADASAWDVDVLRILDALVAGENVDELFAGLLERVEKVIYNDGSGVTVQDQTATVEPGVTVPGAIDFFRIEPDIENANFVLNLTGGNEIQGNLGLASTDKVVGGQDLLHFHLQSLTINSTGDAVNLIDGETTTNIITGDITSQGPTPERTNDLLDVTLNAEQDLMIGGKIIFESVTGDDIFTIGDEDDAIAELTVTGTADVSTGIDTTDDDVDGLEVVNNSTGTLTVRIDDGDIDDAPGNVDSLSFTGTGDIVLVITGSVDLSDDDLSAVTQIVIGSGATAGDLTLTQDQYDAVTLVNGTNAVTPATLNLVEFGASPFDGTAVPAGIDVVDVTLAAGVTTLDPSTNLTGVDRILVPEGGTLNLTAAQFQQLAGAGAIEAFDANGDTVTGSIDVNITDLTQADIDRDLDGDGFLDADDGLDLSGILTSGGDVTVSLAEDVVLGEFIDGVLTAGSAADLAGASVIMEDGQTLGLVNHGQADGLVVGGGTGTTVNLLFDIMFGANGEIEASGYDVTTLRATTVSVDGEDVEVVLDNLPNSVTLNLYEDPAQVGFVSDIMRNVIIEPGAQVPGSLIFNGDDPTRELRMLTITFQGDGDDELTDPNGDIDGATIQGDLILDVEPAAPGLIGDLFNILRLISEGDGDSNGITGDITPLDQDGAGSSVDNSMRTVEVEAGADFTVGGGIYFNSEDATETEASFTVTGEGDVTVEQMFADNGSLTSFTVTNDSTGTMTVTGASHAIFAVEDLFFAGSGDIVLGTDGDGVSGSGTLSVLDASAHTGDLTLDTLDLIDSQNFAFTSGSGVTTLDVGAGVGGGATLNAGGMTDTGWSFDLSDAAAGSEIRFGAGVTWTAGDLSVDLGTDATMYLDASADFTVLGDISISGTIVLADGATLTLTAEQADGLTIIGESGAMSTGVVNIVNLNDDPTDLSGISADIAGTATLEDEGAAGAAENDVTLDAATDLGAFSITLTAVDNTTLGGETIRFTTEEQAAREIIANDIAGAGTNSTNVIWLFESVTGTVDTSDYSGNIGRVWFTEALIDSAADDNVENLFTTLPTAVLRVDFADVTELDVLLNSNSINRVVEFASFSSVGDLTFSDIGLTPEEHIQTLRLNLGGSVTIDDILIDDVVAGPDVDPTTVSFNGITVDSDRVLSDANILAPEGFVNNNDGTIDEGETAQAANLNTIGDIGVGAENGIDLLLVTLDVGAVSVVGDGSAGAGANLVVGDITFDSEPDATATVTATLVLEGANDITIAAVDTSDADIDNFLLDVGAFTGVLDPEMRLDNTEDFDITDVGGSAGVADLTFTDVAGDELSFADFSGSDDDINITFTDIDGSDDDLNSDGDLLDAGENIAFTYSASTGTNVVVVDGPSLDADSTWDFDFTGAGADSSLTIGAGTTFAAGSNLIVQLNGNTTLTIDDAVDVTEVNVTITGNDIIVTEGSSLTITIEQLTALYGAGVEIVGPGTLIVEGDGTDSEDVDPIFESARTANLDLSGVTLVTTGLMADATGALEVTLAAGGARMPNSGIAVIGSAEDDIITGSNRDDTFTMGAGDDDITGGTGDDTFNVDAGTDTINDLFSEDDGDDATNEESDALVVSSGATADATTAGFVATSATSNAGTANVMLVAGAAAGTIDMTEAAGPNGYNITGDATDGVASTLIGSAFADTISDGDTNQDSADDADVLTGNGGADTFVFQVTQSTPIELTQETTTAGEDLELWDVDTGDDGTAAFTVDNDGNQSLTIVFRNDDESTSFTINDTATIDFTDGAALWTRVASELTARGVTTTYDDTTALLSLVGDPGQSVEITNIVVNDTGGFSADAPTQLGAGTGSDADDEAQVTEVTVGDGTGLPLASEGEIYSITVTLAQGSSVTAEYTASAGDTHEDIATALEATLSGLAAGFTTGVVGRVVTITDTDADNGGFTVALDNNPGIGGVGSSALGAGAGDPSLAFADIVTDFVSGEDQIQLGIANGTNANYVESAAEDDYATAYASANAAFDGTVLYYLTSTDDLDGDADPMEDDASGLLFYDANADGEVDGVIYLDDITSANFDETDIIL